MPNGWRTINSLVHKIRLHGRRGKGMAESFSRQKSRHAPQKEGGLKILCDLPPVWPRLVRPTNLMSRMDGKKTHTHYRGTRLNAMKRFCLYSLWSHPKNLIFFSPLWGMLRRSRCVQIFSNNSPCVVVYLTLLTDDPLRIQSSWSQDRRKNQTKLKRKSEISRESRQKRTDKEVASKGHRRDKNRKHKQNPTNSRNKL